MKQSIIIFELFCLYGSSLAGLGGPTPVDASLASIWSITCADDGQGITFTVRIPDGDEWTNTTADRAAWALLGSGCEPDSINSSLVTYGPFDGDTCKSVNVTETPTHLVFDFIIYVQPDGGLTYRYDHHYIISCQYNKVQNNLQASFQPLHSVENTQTDSGVLTINCGVYFSGDGSLIDPGTTIDLKTDIFVLCYVEGEGFPALDIHLRFVEATTAGGDSEVMIVGGCSVNSAVSNATCDAAATDEFSLSQGAFRFANQPNGALVTFEITAVVCLNDAGFESECETQCASCGGPVTPPPFRRKRRDNVQEKLETTYYVKAGPYKFANVEQEQQEQKDSTVDEPDSSAIPTYLVAILAVSGVVAIAIISVAVVIVLRKRVRNATLAESRGTCESGTGAV